MSRESSQVNLSELGGTSTEGLEGDELTAAIMEAARLKQEKLDRAKAKKEEKDLLKKKRASRKF
jgi:hypothetical protein